MGVKKGENVLVLCDTESENIGQALYDQALKLKANAYLIKMKPMTRHGEEPPKAVADFMKQMDVILAPTTFSISHTQARKRACMKGARVSTMPGITEGMMSSGGMTANFKQIEKAIKRVHKAIKGKNDVHITTEAGTDLTLSLKGRKWVTDDTGICHEKGGFINLPAGELFIAPLEGTANGKLVIDGSFDDILEEPVKVTIKDGFAKRFEGGKAVVRQLDKQGKDGRNVAELGIGMNPAASIIGNVLEDEKVLGTIHVAFGDNSTFGGKVKAGVHQDGIVRSPTVYINDVLVMKDGKLKV